MEPYKMALEWIKAEGLSKQYCDSDAPEQRRMWDEFQERDTEGMDTLLKIETNECPALMAQTAGQDVARQVFTPLFHEFDMVPLSDTTPDEPPQQHCSYLPHVWERYRHG